MTFGVAVVICRDRFRIVGTRSSEGRTSGKTGPHSEKRRCKRVVARQGPYMRQKIKGHKGLMGGWLTMMRVLQLECAATLEAHSARRVAVAGKKEALTGAVAEMGV